MATGRYSTFPTVIDKLKLLPELKDMTVEQVGKIARYNELIIKGKNGTLTSAEQLELDGLHQEMKTYNLSPTDWNTVISAMINIEKYLKDTILPEIGTMVDNAELQINTSVTNGVNIVDGKVNSVIPQIDKYVSDLINNNANVVSVGHLRNQFTITSETNKVAIGIHGFNVNTDVLTLTVSGTQYYQYQNGSGDYTIDSATNIITLVGDKKFYVDEIVLIEIVKNVMKNVPIMDVGLLADDSIMRVKLDQDTQDILNHMERVVDNQSFTVPSTAWVGTEPNLTYKIVHKMNNKNLIVGVVDTDTQMSKLPDFKYIDMNTIEMHSVSKDNITVVINANGYSGSDGNIVSQEVIDARKGEVSLKSKIDGIDSQLAEINYKTTKNPYIVVEGDSTAKGGTSGARWDLWLSMMLKRPIINNAVWGSWTEQVKNRLKENVIDLHPEYCILLMGTNDIHGGENRRNSLQNYSDILDELIKNSIKPVVCTVLPRNDFPSDNATIRIFNNCLLDMCQKKGVIFIDLYNTLAKDDGNAKDYILHNADNLHWSTYGAVLGAKEIFKVFKIYSQNNIEYPRNLFKGDYPILENGIFDYNPTGDVLAEYWDKIGTPICSLIDNPKGGKFQVISKKSTSQASAGLKKEKFGGLTESATYKFQCDYEIKFTDRNDLNANCFISLDFYNSSGANIGSIVVDEVWYSTGIEMTEIYKEFTPPAGTYRTTLNFSANATSPFEMKIGRAYINVIR